MPQLRRALEVVLLLCALNASIGVHADKKIQVLVYGSTPSGIMAAVAAARHGATVGLLSQRVHVGGVCSGGLGQTDIGMHRKASHVAIQAANVD